MQHRITQAITARADDGPPPAPAGVSVAEPSARPGRAAFLGGRGAKLFDVSGRSWIDCDLGGGALILGHAATAVQSALEATLASGWSVAAGSDVERLCALIAAAVPHHDDVRLFAAAWQAQGFAVAQACLATGRRAVGRFAHRRDSVGGPIHARIANGWTVTERTMRYGDASDLADLAAGHLALAAVIVDAADFVRDPDGFEAWLNELSAACAVQGTRLILDDTATGFKLAYGGLQEHLGFEADAALFGRIVGGGIPLAAVTSTRAGADRPARDAALHCGESDGGFDPFALAAGAATLSVLSEHREAVYAELFAAGRRLRDDLNAVMAARGPHPPASAAGPVVSVHAAVSAWLGPSAGTEQARKAALHLKTLAHRRGVVIGPGDLAHLSTAHTAQDLAEIAPTLGAAIEELHGVLTGAR